MSAIDDLVPTPLHAFTPDTLNQLKTSGRCESLFFEFKREWRPDDVTRCVCAFANSQGGFLFFGVEQTQDGCIDSFPGLPRGEEYPTLAKDRILGHVSPLPMWDAIAVDSPDDAARSVLVLRIAASNRTPHVTRSGVIYVRTPAACDPVRDRATVDVLVERGNLGKAYLKGRLDELWSLPWRQDETGASSWVMQVAAVPSPASPGSYSDFVTDRGFDAAAGLFAGRAGAPHAERALEDGVLLRHGVAELACLTDGAMVYQLRTPVGDNRVVHASWVSDMAERLLAAQRTLQPPVLESHLVVTLRGTAGFRITQKDAFGFDETSELPLRGDWSYSVETLTDEGSAQTTARMFRRRLWRAVGERDFEPSAPSETEP